MTIQLSLTIHVAEGADHSDIVQQVNGGVLCRLEDDDKTITEWAWSAYDENDQEVEL